MAKVFEQLHGVIRTTPTVNPPAGQMALYPKADGWYSLTSAGVERKVSDVAVGTVYRATLLGANGSLTSTTVSKTDFAVALTGAYSAEGVYTLTAASGTPFTADKTVVRVWNSNATGAVIFNGVVTSTSVITINTFAADGTTPADAIGSFFVEITVDA